MLVSIIIPIYNVEQYIVTCLESVIGQTYKTLEVILVDDCGTDESIALARNFLSHVDSSIKFKFILHQNNMGLSAARNSGIKAASGEYIYFLDSDDYLIPECIELLIRQAESGRIDCVIANFRIVGEGKRLPLISIPSNILDTTDKIRKSFYLNQWTNLACNKLINRAFLNVNNLFFVEGLYHEDVLWGYFLANRAKTMSVVQEETYIYVLRNNSISSRVRLKNLKDRVTIFEKIFELSTLQFTDDLFVEYFEGHKLFIYKDIIKCDASISEKFLIYKRLRTITFTNVLSFKIKKRRTIGRFLQFLHYALSIRVGFAYIMFFYRLT